MSPDKCGISTQIGPRRLLDGRVPVCGSGREIGNQLYNEFGTGELDGIDFQSVPADKAKGGGYSFWRLEAARAAPE